MTEPKQCSDHRSETDGQQMHRGQCRRWQIPDTPCRNTETVSSASPPSSAPSTVQAAESTQLPLHAEFMG